MYPNILFCNNQQKLPAAYATFALTISSRCTFVSNEQYINLPWLEQCTIDEFRFIPKKHRKVKRIWTDTVCNKKKRIGTKTIYFKKKLQ